MFLTAKELRDRALAATGGPRDGIAPSIPVPTGKERVTSAAVFYYREPPSPNSRVVFPPHFLVRLDPTTGQVIKAAATKPSDIGPDAPLDVELPRHPDERRPADIEIYWQHFDRLLEIFHEAWWAFDQGVVRFTPELRARVAECADLFDEVCEKRVLPWYEGLAGPFLAWMRAVRDKNAPRP